MRLPFLFRATLLLITSVTLSACAGHTPTQLPVKKVTADKEAAKKVLEQYQQQQHATEVSVPPAR